MANAFTLSIRSTFQKFPGELFKIPAMPSHIAVFFTTNSSLEDQELHNADDKRPGKSFTSSKVYLVRALRKSCLISWLFLRLVMFYLVIVLQGRSKSFVVCRPSMPGQPLICATRSCPEIGREEFPPMGKQQTLQFTIHGLFF